MGMGGKSCLGRVSVRTELIEAVDQQDEVRPERVDVLQHMRQEQLQRRRHRVQQLIEARPCIA